MGRAGPNVRGVGFGMHLRAFEMVDCHELTAILREAEAFSSIRQRTHPYSILWWGRRGRSFELQEV